MQKKVMALCLRVQFFLANPVYTASKEREARTKTSQLHYFCPGISVHYAIPPIAMSDMCQQPGTADDFMKGQNILNTLGIHRPSPQNDGYDGRQSPQRLSSIHISRQKEMRIRANRKNMT